MRYREQIEWHHTLPKSFWDGFFRLKRFACVIEIEIFHSLGHLFTSNMLAVLWRHYIIQLTEEDMLEKVGLDAFMCLRYIVVCYKYV